MTPLLRRRKNGSGIVRTTGKAGGLLWPYKGLLPATLSGTEKADKRTTITGKPLKWLFTCSLSPTHP
jgi:hypothetical protein